MRVVWHGSDLYKAYHDPKSGTLDLVASRAAGGGQAVAMGDEFALAVDDSGAFCHLGVDVRKQFESPEPPNRPPDAAVAGLAEVELVESDAPRWLFDSTAGSLRISFGEADVKLWGRVGENLLWLGLSQDGDMAALVFEGISHDPGGGAQAAWLEEVGAG
jgi:hypothetical protein